MCYIRPPPCVGIPGFEPGTPCSKSRCANRTALHPELAFSEEKLCTHYLFIEKGNTAPSGGMDGTRTRDPLRDRQVF